MNTNLPTALLEKIYQIKTDSQNNLLNVVSYFPLSEEEKKLVIADSKYPASFDIFNSIFSDHISEIEWNKTKQQIIKRFQDELFDID